MPVVKEIAASDVRAVPEVGAVVERHGWGALDAGGLVAFPGRNENWAGRTSAGVGVFVKKIDGAGAAERFGRALSFTRLPQAGRGVPSPECLGFDRESRVMVFELLEGASTGSDLARDGRFTTAMACKAGRIVGLLHRTPAVKAAAVLDTSAPSWPRLDGPAMTADAFTAASGAQLEMYGLVQNDTALVGAVTQLAEASLRAPKAPAHCDLRLDQFLLHGRKLYLADWEELRLADPARDVGAYVGEWLHRSLRAINGDGTLTAAEVLPRCVRELERRRPYLDAFWTGYRATVDTPDPRLASRAAGYAGWHLLDRILAAGREHARLNALDRAAIGIAGRILRSPDAHRAALGLTTPAQDGSVNTTREHRTADTSG
ncbi:class V lanthionine synthetase subunit LxmK [Streptomyces erythrochromogenes]|uniref:class V lanthionine synthetase subunit LxmK n=1 Tax=Streptomyces erythrochromogenes TaxID=285574 RepID=UPI00343AF694